MARRSVYVVGALLLAMGSLAAVLRATGATSPSVRAIPVGAAPVALALAPRTGRLFVVNEADSSVSVIDTRGGRGVATTLLSGPPVSPRPLTVDDRTGRVFMLDGQDVDVLDARSGARLATTGVGSGVGQVGIGPPAIDARRGHIVVLTRNPYGQKGDVSMLDARSGALLRVAHLRHNPNALAVDGRTGRVFVSNLGPTRGGGIPIGPGSVSVLDAASGRLLRTTRLGTWPSTPVVDAATDRVFVVNNPASGAGSVSTLDGLTGRLLATTPVGRYPHDLFVDQRRNHIFVGSARGLLMLDARSGRLLRPIRIRPDRAGNAATVVAIDERHDRIVAAMPAGMALLNARDGRLARVVPLGNGEDIAGVAADTRAGRVYAVVRGPMNTLPNGMQGNPVAPGIVDALDIRTGALLHTATVGLMPVDVAVDEHSGHVFVADLGCPVSGFPCGGTPAPWPWGWIPVALRRRLPWLPRPAPTPMTRTGAVSMLTPPG